jgi:enterochelin esterase-like enzyme
VVLGAMGPRRECKLLVRSVILEPQSTTFFLLLIVVFGALMWWLVVAKQLVFRVFAACLAFIPAMMFGVAAVNKYYDYYQNWSAVISDLTGSNVQQPALPTVSKIQGAGVHFGTFLGNQIDLAVAAQVGDTARILVPGGTSQVAPRAAFVYFPPQYFQKAYQSYRFPAIELLHGFPGVPQDWITVVGVTTMLQGLISQNLAKPAVLVMPDVNGGRGISLQCLNQVGGPQDATFLAEDLPQYISRKFRVLPPGPAWGLAGYSEGGFCAANLGLKYGSRFGYSGVLSGYFQPADNQLAGPSRLVDPFGGSKTLKKENTPDDLVSSLPAGVPIPQFWLGVGADDRGDLRNAAFFEQLLQVRQPSVTLKVVSGGGHTMFTWRALMPSLLEWMTPRIAYVGTLDNEAAQNKAKKAAAAQRKRAATRHHK